MRESWIGLSIALPSDGRRAVRVSVRAERGQRGEVEWRAEIYVTHDVAVIRKCRLAGADRLPDLDLLSPREDVRVEDLSRQRVALDVRGRGAVACRDPFDDVVLGARCTDIRWRVDDPNQRAAERAIPIQDAVAHSRAMGRGNRRRQRKDN